MRAIRSSAKIATADIQRYTDQRDRDERQADARMRRMNKQLKAMITEGQQALAMKVEVNDRNTLRFDETMDLAYDDEGYRSSHGDEHGSDEIIYGRRKVWR